jgi:hypothetical protein
MKMRKKSIRGQAIAELLIAMVGLTVAMAAVLQVCRAGNTNIANLYESRRDAEDKARSATFDSGGVTIGDWDVGADGLRHTADDEIIRARHEGLLRYDSEVREPFDIRRLESLDLNDGFTPYIDEFSRGQSANLFRGEERVDVPLEPALQSLLFITKDRLELSDQTYMPGMDLDTF